MNDWAPKRFWTDTDVVALDSGFTVSLDSRRVMTPGKRPLIVPTHALADAIAAEWAAQDDLIQPATMPMTRAANSAIEKVAPQKDAVVTELAAFGETDLLCYRSDRSDALAASEAASWDPLLAWATDALNAPLRVAKGVMPVAQDSNTLAVLRQRVAALDHFALTGFHDLVAISGSLVLGFAVIHDRLTPRQAWEISRIDEEFQIAEWGRDEDEAALVALKMAAFLSAADFYRLSII